MSKDKKIIWVSLIPLALLIPIQFLNHTGFCYSKMRYLSERELIDRFLFGENANRLSTSEKEKLIVQRKKKNTSYIIENYPECCRIKGQIHRPSELEYFLNNMFGWYFYDLHVISSRHEDNITRYTFDEPYRQANINLGTCGLSTRGSLGANISKDYYKSLLKKNQNYWKDKN